MCKSIPRVAAALVACLVMTTNAAFALPGFGESCSSCHGTNVGGTNPDKMAVTNFDDVLDLGTQLDGKTRGPLSTFTASPGDTVSLQMTVTDGSQHYAVQLKRLYKPGQQNSLSNFLTSPMYGTTSVPPWTSNGVDPVNGPQWFTQGPIQDGLSNVVYSFDLVLDPNTPIDVYDLEFAIAGGSGFTPGSWYEDEHFYLNVVDAIPEPTTLALAGLGILGICAGYSRKRRYC